MGFNKDNVAVVKLDLAFRDPKSAAVRFESILNDLKNNRHVQSVSTNGVVPTAYDQNYNNYIDPSTYKEVGLRQEPADAGFVSTYEIPIIQGKNFNDDLAASEENAVLINRAAMDAFGWKNAVGKQIKSKGDEGDPYTVIGVMENFHYQDLQNNIEPLIQWYSGKPKLGTRYLSVRTDNGEIKPVMESTAAGFQKNAGPQKFQL